MTTYRLSGSTPIARSSIPLRCDALAHPEVRHELLDLHRQTRCRRVEQRVGLSNDPAHRRRGHLRLPPAPEDLRVARRDVGEQAAAGRPVLGVEQLRAAALDEIEHLADPVVDVGRNRVPRERLVRQRLGVQRVECLLAADRLAKRRVEHDLGGLDRGIGVVAGSCSPIAASSASGPCSRSERINSWYSGSNTSTAAIVSSVSPGRMPRSWWQNRMNARSTSGASARTSTSAMILRGIQSSSRISTAVGLQCSGSPGP